MNRFSWQTLVSMSILAALPLAAGGPSDFSAPSRTILFTYQITIKDLPSGARRLQVWVPRAVTDAHQTVVLKKMSGPVQLRETREAEFGNHVLYGELAHPGAGPLEFTVQYQVTRKEYSRGDYESLKTAAHGSSAEPKNLARFLAPDLLVPTNGKIKELADQNTRGKQGTLEKAYALYDYVFKTVRYDKSGTGWGRGDSLWVCDARHGNCTDFHSLFISLARAEGIPARFEIGFPLPLGDASNIPGYHCWAEFFVAGLGWIPVDISEAWKDPRKHDYFFGSLDSNRVQFSVGRDLKLPKQAGGPLNYFIYPYVEVDGKPFASVSKKFMFQDTGAQAGAAAAGL